MMLNSAGWDGAEEPARGRNRRQHGGLSRRLPRMEGTSLPERAHPKPGSTDAMRGLWSDGGCGVREYAGEDLMPMKWTMRGVCPTPGGC